jgi:cytochrome P450
MKKISSYAIPGLEQRRRSDNPPRSLTTLDNMMDIAQTEQESDPKFVAKLQSALNAGGVHPTAILVVNVLFDLAKYPQFQDILRDEIRAKHREVKGNWDHKAFDTLHKLDSALKETLRFNPATLTAYTRVIQEDCELSSGLRLRKGQLICVPSCSSQKDPIAFPEPDRYDALRSYNEAQDGKHVRPFKGIDEHAHRWGAGRSACPGRFLASLIVKVMLVKLLDDFEFKLEPKTSRPDSTMMHEFIWVSLNAKLMVKRRDDSCGIMY